MKKLMNIGNHELGKNCAMTSSKHVLHYKGAAGTAHQAWFDNFILSDHVAKN